MIHIQRNTDGSYSLSGTWKNRKIIARGNTLNLAQAEYLKQMRRTQSKPRATHSRQKFDQGERYKALSRGY